MFCNLTYYSLYVNIILQKFYTDIHIVHVKIIYIFTKSEGYNNM